MVATTSSDPIREHPVFSDLLDLINTIPPPVCSSTTDANAPVSFCNCDTCKNIDLLDKLKGDAKYIHDSLQNLSSFEQKLGYRLGPLKSQVKEPGFLAEPGFKEVVSAVKQLKFKLHYTSFHEFRESDDLPVSFQEDPSPEAGDPKLISNFNDLKDPENKCLWCFSVFPENAEVKKRVLINWWIGEGFLDNISSSSSGSMKSTGQGKGEDMLKNLEEKGYIEQVVKKKRRTNRWRMPATVRSRLLNLTEEEGLGNIILTQTKNSNLDRRNSNEAKTVFNVDKSVITEREAGLVADMKNLVVLHLGKSHVRGLDLITRSLRKKKKLSFLSLEGILSLKELPPWVCNLKTLRVLDLSECQALERLPSGIGSLKSLEHLDVSGCHLLSQMPEALKSLPGLEVLKGFVIGPTTTTTAGCTLKDLGSLESLRELSLSVFRINFPTTQDLTDLAGVFELVSLKIQWKPARQLDTPLKPLSAQLSLPKNLVCCLSSDGFPVDVDEDAHPTSLATVLPKLEKLDLRFPPKDSASSLLVPTNFPALKKLYITGSELGHLQPHNAAVWEKVEVLRLISLPQLSQDDSDDLLKLFPRLSYLEKLNCPDLQFSKLFDDQGVWTKQQ